MRRLLHKYVPAHFRNPVRLAARLAATRDPAALFAMGAAVAGMVATPLDLAMTPWERRQYAKAPATTGPLLFICGAPRSGTTLVYQTLVNALPVAPFTNVVQIFPRSPLVATKMLQRWGMKPSATYRNFYGRTAGLSGLNDALPLWDRFLGDDRSRDPEPITPQVAARMRRFFAAWSVAFGLPVASKCNRVVVAAADLAQALPEAIFICLEREPLPHAFSLLEARRMIHGDERVPYGQAPEQSWNAEHPTASVACQVQYYQELVRRQLALVGPERFWIQSYEEFCRNPDALVRRAASALFPAGRATDLPPVLPYEPRCGSRPNAGLAARMERELAALGLLDSCGESISQQSYACG